VLFVSLFFPGQNFTFICFPVQNLLHHGLVDFMF
jgi:hypothetical protein